MKLYRKMVLIGSMALAVMVVTAQEISPMDIQIGKPLPELVLKDLQNFDKSELSTGELKGNPFILKFWDRFCSGAMRQMYRTDELAKEFKGQIKVFVVAGKAGPFLDGDTPLTEPKILEAQFERMSRLRDLSLPITYDLELFEQVVPGGVPHFLLVDEKGIVKAVTAELNQEIIISFLKGEDVMATDYSKRGQIKEEGRIDAYDYHRYFLVDNNGGREDSFEFRSIITPYTDDMPMGKTVPSQLEMFDYWKKIEGVGSLREFYKLAYFGAYFDFHKTLKWKNYPIPVLELEDPSPFRDFRYNRPLKHMYWYSLVVPERLGNTSSLMKIMQDDLEAYFGYVAGMEKRTLPFWSITLPDNARKRLKSKGGEQEIESDYHTMMRVRNLPIGEFLQKLLYLVDTSDYGNDPMLDRTGGGINIDVPLREVDFFNFMDIKKFLEQLGFRVEKVYEEFDALVIYDKKENGGEQVR